MTLSHRYLEYRNNDPAYLSWGRRILHGLDCESPGHVISFVSHLVWLNTNHISLANVTWDTQDNIHQRMTLSANSAFQKLLWTISPAPVSWTIKFTGQMALHSITRDNFCNCRRYAIISLWTHSNTLASCVIEQLTFYGDIYTAVQKFEVSRIKKIQNKYLYLQRLHLVD